VSGGGQQNGGTGALSASALPSAESRVVPFLGGIPAALVAWVREDLGTIRPVRELAGQKGMDFRQRDNGVRLAEQ
jgi:hypothetical protein